MTYQSGMKRPEYDLSVMPNLKWAVFIGPFMHFPNAIPRSLSKLLLVSYKSASTVHHLQCDLDSLDLLALITVQDLSHFWSDKFLAPRLVLHEADSTCKAASFPSGVKG